MRNLTDIYSEDGESKTNQTILIVAALFLTILAIVAVTLVTRRTLNKAMEERKQEDALLANEAISNQGDTAGGVELLEISHPVAERVV